MLLVDFINPLDFEGAARLAPMALAAAKATARLKARCRRAGWPTIYANDNFGHWNSDFKALVEKCRALPRAAAIIDAIEPDRGDLSVLKPRHSAFFGTPLEFLLSELGTTGLVITGIAADSCIMFTAMDAFLRTYPVWAPRDCVAAESPSRREIALSQMRRIAKVWVGPSHTPLRRACSSTLALHRGR